MLEGLSPVADGVHIRFYRKALSPDGVTPPVAPVRGQRFVTAQAGASLLPRLAALTRLRRELRAKRRALPAPLRAQLDRTICAHPRPAGVSPRAGHRIVLGVRRRAVARTVDRDSAPAREAPLRSRAARLDDDLPEPEPDAPLAANFFGILELQARRQDRRAQARPRADAARRVRRPRRPRRRRARVLRPLLSASYAIACVGATEAVSVWRTS